jgi:hypothetical protein
MVTRWRRWRCVVVIIARWWRCNVHRRRIHHRRRFIYHACTGSRFIVSVIIWIVHKNATVQQ